MNRRILSVALSSLMLMSTSALAHGPTQSSRDDHKQTHVRPADASLTVKLDNDVGRAITVLADGRQIAVVSADDRERLTVPADTKWLEARVNGRKIERLRLKGVNVSWEVERPKETNLVIYNPLPIPVEVRVGGTRRTVGAEGSILMAGVDVGSTKLVARRIGGELVERETVRLTPFDDHRWEVQRPDEGLVRVVNRWSSPLKVEINGEVVGVLEAGQRDTYSIRAGRADVVLTRLSRGGRQGAEVLDTRIRVDRYEIEVVQTGSSGRSHSHNRPGTASVR